MGELFAQLDRPPPERSAIPCPKEARVRKAPSLGKGGRPRAGMRRGKRPFSAYLSLGEAQGSGQLGSFRQSQVLGLLEAPVQSLELQAGVNRPGLPDFFPFAVKAHFAAFHYGAFLCLGPWKKRQERPVRDSRTPRQPGGGARISTSHAARSQPGSEVWPRPRLASKGPRCQSPSSALQSVTLNEPPSPTGSPPKPGGDEAAVVQRRKGGCWQPRSSIARGEGEEGERGKEKKKEEKFFFLFLQAAAL